MGNVIFWICFLLLIAALVVSGIHQSRSVKASRIKKLADDYDSDTDSCYSDCAFRNDSAMLKYLCDRYPDDSVLDEITISDLLLSQLYSRMNRCVSGAGEEYLNCRFRMMHSSSDEADRIRDEIEQYISDPQGAHKARVILDKCPKNPDDDGFMLISDLAGSDKSGVLADILPVAALLVSVCIMPFFMRVGTVAAIISLCVCIGTYFSGRSRMEDDLKGLALCLKYLRCAKLLADSQYSRFETYRGIFGLAKAAFLIPYKDGTTSNPLSILFDYVRMITHIDLIAYKIRIAKITEKIDEIRNLYMDIGRLDAVIATASYISQKDHCKVTIADDDRLNAKGLYHPLVNDAVKNDINTTGGMLLTGSNASGKSTFLKAIGISTLFAQSFGIAFADSYETKRYELFTSMALSDDLLAGESYYVVEARSIKRICDAASSGGCLCIIDEVLRGTNTVERIAASCAILRFLCRPNVLMFAATHDLELPKMLSDDVEAYYFTEEIIDNEVVFPYVLHKGTTDRTNAIRLLSALGFDHSVTDTSNRLAEEYRKSGKWKMTS